MYKKKHTQKTITLSATENRGEAPFHIPSNSPIVGIGTKAIGDLPAGASADIIIMDGANNVLDALDIDFTEITTKGSSKEIITPLNIANPSDIRAEIVTSLPIENAKTFSVKVALFYAAGSLTPNEPTLETCL